MYNYFLSGKAYVYYNLLTYTYGYIEHSCGHVFSYNTMAVVQKIWP